MLTRNLKNLSAGLLGFLIVQTGATLAWKAYAACATAGRDGSPSLSGLINTYYPPAAVTTLSSGATVIALGSASGSTVPISVGDLVLVIQVQDASISVTQTANYGAGTGTGSGATAFASTGLYEYATAASTVPTGGGSLTLTAGLSNTYHEAAASAASGQKTFEVIRV
ncbi:MAG TPA: hypothetical protein VFR02_04270, partial [bacterium]|nr:hypothetical protein [bacterium]